MSQHTALPWKVGISGRDLETTDGRRIAHNFYAKKAGSSQRIPYEEIMGNMELIVTAVNSYQAMKEALEKLVRYWGKTGPEYAQYDKLEDYVQMAKRALIIANGEDPKP